MDNKLVGVSLVMLVVGAAVGGVGGALLRRAPDASLVLSGSGSQCTWQVKQDGLVKRGQNFTLQIRNKCGDTTVDLGNFRLAAASANGNCTSAVEGGATWPFTDDPNDLGKRQVQIPAGATRNIVLHEAKHGPGSGDDQYYFDACINGVRVDPRLVIE